VAHFALDAGQRLYFFTAPAEFTTMVRLHSLAVDYRVFLFALCAAAAAAGGAALLPALQATRLDLVSALRGEFGSAFRASRLRSALVVLQVVVCAVLLVCGALLYRRAGVFQNRPTGIRHDHVVFISSENTEVAAGLRLRADVEDVAVASGIPWMRRLSRTTVMASGESGAQIAGYNLVSPRYFHVLDIALRRGRFYTDQETRDGAAVAVVSQATAQAFGPGEDPIGKTIRPVEAWERHVDNLPLRGEFRVIGVAEDVIHGWAFDGTDPTCIYLPASERTAGAGLLLARVRGDEHAALQGIRQWLLDRWPEFEGQTFRLGAIFDMQIYPFRAAAWDRVDAWSGGDGLERLGNVRSDVLYRQPAVQGDRHPHGAGGGAGRRGVAGIAPQSSIGLNRRRDRWSAGGGRRATGAMVERRLGHPRLGRAGGCLRAVAGGGGGRAGIAGIFAPGCTGRS
jgi:hypothetical protein